MDRSTATPREDGDRKVTGLRLEPGGRRIQLPQLTVALLLVGLSALVAVVLFSQAAARQPVIAVASDLVRGDVVGVEDLQVVYVGSDDPIVTIPESEMGSLVGLSVVADLAAGTILTPAHLVTRSGLADDEGVVGVALSPGEYPSARLAVGDRVSVVDTDPADGGVEVLVSEAVIFDISELGSQGVRFVSLSLSTEAAGRVADAAADGRVRLILVSGGSS